MQMFQIWYFLVDVSNIRFPRYKFQTHGSYLGLWFTLKCYKHCNNKCNKHIVYINFRILCNMIQMSRVLIESWIHVPDGINKLEPQIFLWTLPSIVLGDLKWSLRGEMYLEPNCHVVYFCRTLEYCRSKHPASEKSINSKQFWCYFATSTNTCITTSKLLQSDNC